MNASPGTSLLPMWAIEPGRRDHRVGAVRLVMEEKPWSDEMLATFQERIGREVSLL